MCTHTSTHSQTYKHTRTHSSLKISERIRDGFHALVHMAHARGDLNVRLRMITSLSTAMIAGYVLLPFDLLPEASFGFLGFLDDFFFALFLISFLVHMYRVMIVERR